MTITEYLSIIQTNATLLGFFASRDDSCCVSVLDRMHVFIFLSTKVVLCSIAK